VFAAAFAEVAGPGGAGRLLVTELPLPGIVLVLPGTVLAVEPDELGCGEGLADYRTVLPDVTTQLSWRIFRACCTVSWIAKPLNAVAHW
jgi:hypothetical protein